jgi:hypothetical protein
MARQSAEDDFLVRDFPLREGFEREALLLCEDCVREDGTAPRFSHPTVNGEGLRDPTIENCRVGTVSSPFVWSELAEVLLPRFEPGGRGMDEWAGAG